ncbi:MAG: GNAT family N-acetyltransferase [Clostridia bacterium]|nr:GNAT family N-acetyltransferase [Clostridia bacterium]
MCRKNADVYKRCPSFENERFLLRFAELSDCDDLLKVYSDKKAVPFFNSDNCGGDDFYYTTTQRMTEAIKYWLWEYGRKGFVRWAIVDKSSDKVIGTIELFRRTADDFFTDCGLLRLDLRSDYEKSDIIENILSLITPPTFTLFNCDKIATKSVEVAEERRKALVNCGFSLSFEKLIGHDGTLYSDYYVMSVN